MKYKTTNPAIFGKIPEGWKIVRIKDSGIAIIDGDRGVNYPKKSEFATTGFCLFLSAKNVTKDGFRFAEKQFISKEKDEKMGKGKLKKFDIVLTTRGTIGNVAYYDEKVPYDHIRINSGMVILRIETKEIDHKFFYILLIAPFMQERIKRVAYGTGQPQLNVRIISNLQIPLPPLPEQRKIAEILSTVDSAIQQTDEAILKSERLKKGLMQELLTKGIGHSEFKETEIGRIPKEWDVVRLGEICGGFQYGLSIKMGEEGQYPIVKMDSLVNGMVEPINLRYVDLDKSTFEKYKLKKGDILLNRTNSYELVGRSGLFMLDGDYVFASYLIRMEPNHSTIFSKFLAFYLLFSIERLRKMATRAVSQANINATNLKNFKIPLPPLSEQKKIAEILSAVDEKIALEKERKAKLERVKKGLMNDLLIGKKRVKMDGGDLR